jgi:hypothetical protein
MDIVLGHAHFLVDEKHHGIVSVDHLETIGLHDHGILLDLGFEDD